MHYKIVKADEAGGGGLSVRDLLYKINVKKANKKINSSAI